MKYPNPCVRCGFCCLASVCIAGQHIYGLFEKGTRCPALSFHNVIAICKPVKFNLVPVGEGCCLKASAFRNGVEYDFAALPAETKREIVRITLEGDSSQ
jgi:hypothetical protein